MRILAALALLALALLVWERTRRNDDPPAPTPARAAARPPVAHAALPAQDAAAVSLAAMPERIADAAGILGGFGDTLEWQSQAWRDDLGIEIHVVTLRDPSRPIETLAEEVFQLRRIGEGSPSGGLLVLLNPARGEARIEVSYALEHVFPDAIVGRITDGQLAPYAAYRAAGMAAMDVLNLLKDLAFLRAISGEFDLSAEYRTRPEFLEKQRFLSGGAGAQATLAAAALADRDFKAPVPDPKRARYAPSDDPAESADALLRTMRDLVGDPTLELFTPGSRCMLEAYPYAPFEQLERLQRIEASKPLRAAVQGDHAVLDSERPAHGFVPILLERRDGSWRVDLVETWKNLFFDERGEYWQKNSNHPYAFALSRFRTAGAHDIAPWSLGTSDLRPVRSALEARDGSLDEFLLGELLFRNCWLPIEALTHYERAVGLAPESALFWETLGDRASYVGFFDMAVSAYQKPGDALLLPLTRAQWAAGDLEAATESVRKVLARDSFHVEALELLAGLLAAQGDGAGSREIERRLAKIRSDPTRPDAPVTLTFDPPRPVLHVDEPVRVPTESGEVTVYEHSNFVSTLTNTGTRDVEILHVTMKSQGTAQASGLGGIEDYWTYPAGPRRLRPGESLTFAKTWGFTVRKGHQQVRYTFDVCWKNDDARRCRYYHTDQLPL